MKRLVLIGALAPVLLWLPGCAGPATNHPMAGHEATQGGIVDHTRRAGSGIGIAGGPPTGPAICADCDGVDNTRDD